MQSIQDNPVGQNINTTENRRKFIEESSKDQKHTAQRLGSKGTYRGTTDKEQKYEVQYEANSSISARGGWLTNNIEITQAKVYVNTLHIIVVLYIYIEYRTHAEALLLIYFIFSLYNLSGTYLVIF
jgi:hypothetical protein